MKANNPKGASSEAEILSRMEDIMGLVVDGQPFRVIRQYASEACSWHVSDITLRRYIGRCTAGFWEHSQAEIVPVRGQAALRLERLYARAAQKGDLRAALAVYDRIARLYDLNNPRKHQRVTLADFDAELVRLNEELAEAERAAEREARELGDEPAE